MIKVKIKNNCFEAIKVTGEPDQFSELKQFCGDAVTITYETCSIDDYWCIKLKDDLTRKEDVVPTGFYIVKFLGSCFTIVSNFVMNNYFEQIQEDNG